MPFGNFTSPYAKPLSWLRQYKLPSNLSAMSLSVNSYIF